MTSAHAGSTGVLEGRSYRTDPKSEITMAALGASHFISSKVLYLAHTTNASEMTEPTTANEEEEEQVIGIIGGTGLGDSLSKRVVDGTYVTVDTTTPFGTPSDAILVGHFGKRKIAFLNRHGKGHQYPPSKVPFAANIFALKQLGVHTVVSMGAVGSLNEEIAPGDLVIVDQFIDKTFKRQGTFFGDYGAVHVEMADPVCSRLCEKLIETGKKSLVINNNQHKIHPKGTYVCMEGPSFSTRAESLMHKAWGGDLIGMTAMPEAKLCREAQMCYCLIALVSDYDCWKEHNNNNNSNNTTTTTTKKKILLQEIIANMNTACTNCVELIEAVLGSDHVLNGEDCLCRKSLELAIWTDEDAIREEEKEKLKVLFE